MAPMKSSREMAVARASGNNRKRPSADSDSDIIGDSDSDFSMTQAGGGRPRAKKKPKIASSTKSLPHESNKIANIAAVTLTGVKLPKEMACPEGITPFSKTHWKAIVQTDDFWEYLHKMVPPSALKTRLVVSINSNLKAEQAQRQEAKEAKTSVRQPSAMKGGPVHLDFSARDGSTEPTQQHMNRDADEITHPATNSGQVDSAENQAQENIDKAEGEESIAGASRLLKGGLTLEQYSKGLEEQKRLMAQIESQRAKQETEVKSEDVGAGNGNTGSEESPKSVDD